MLIPTKARTEWVMEHPSKGSFLLDYGDASTLEKWTWCDALFMAPPVYARLYNITGDKKFLRFMDKEYKETYEFLYDKDARLFYRDHRYFTQKRPMVRRCFGGEETDGYWVDWSKFFVNFLRKINTELFMRTCLWNWLLV